MLASKKKRLSARTFRTESQLSLTASRQTFIDENDESLSVHDKNLDRLTTELDRFFRRIKSDIDRIATNR